MEAQSLRRSGATDFEAESEASSHLMDLQDRLGEIAAGHAEEVANVESVFEELQKLKGHLKGQVSGMQQELTKVAGVALQHAPDGKRSGLAEICDRVQALEKANADAAEDLRQQFSRLKLDVSEQISGLQAATQARPDMQQEVAKNSEYVNTMERRIVKMELICDQSVNALEQRIDKIELDEAVKYSHEAVNNLTDNLKSLRDEFEQLLSGCEKGGPSLSRPFLKEVTQRIQALETGFGDNEHIKNRLEQEVERLEKSEIGSLKTEFAQLRRESAADLSSQSVATELRAEFADSFSVLQLELAQLKETSQVLPTTMDTAEKTVPTVLPTTVDTAEKTVPTAEVLPTTVDTAEKAVPTAEELATSSTPTPRGSASQEAAEPAPQAIAALADDSQPISSTPPSQPRRGKFGKKGADEPKLLDLPAGGADPEKGGEQASSRRQSWRKSAETLNIPGQPTAATPRSSTTSSTTPEAVTAENPSEKPPAQAKKRFGSPKPKTDEGDLAPIPEPPAPIPEQPAPTPDDAAAGEVKPKKKAWAKKKAEG